jgi:N-acetylglucosamine kinase-like BadF-type ATPase
MIIAADSGSTKTSWMWRDEAGQTHEVITAGYNPYHVDAAFIAGDLRNYPKLIAIVEQAKSVFFYGAGCSAELPCRVVETALREVFTGAEITVMHDMMGAARAVYKGQPGYVSILGTGSNCCFFDGQEVFARYPSLGYILGDEGSGNWFGKQVLRDYFYRRLPPNLAHELEQSLKLELGEVLNALYHQPRPNAFLATVMPVLYDQRHSEYVQRLLFGGFRLFVELHLQPFSPEDTPCHFVGSVAWFFKAELCETLQMCGLEAGNFLQTPASGLLEYHLKTTAR